MCGDKVKLQDATDPKFSGNLFGAIRWKNQEKCAPFEIQFNLWIFKSLAAWAQISFKKVHGAEARPVARDGHDNDTTATAGVVFALLYRYIICHVVLYLFFSCEGVGLCPVPPLATQKIKTPWPVLRSPGPKREGGEIKPCSSMGITTFSPWT